MACPRQGFHRVDDAKGDLVLTALRQQSAQTKNEEYPLDLGRARSSGRKYVTPDRYRVEFSHRDPWFLPLLTL